jgi:hypothetical protein
VEGLPALGDLLERGVYVREIPEFTGAIESFARLPLAERQQIADRCHAYVQSIYAAPSRQTQWQRLLGVRHDQEPATNVSLALP